MTHEDRVWHHEMETLEGIHEHAERIASLEELVQAMWDTHLRSKHKPTAYGWVAIIEQAEELGIELVYE